MKFGAILGMLGKGAKAGAKAIANNPDKCMTVGGKVLKFADGIIHKEKNESAGKVSEEYYQKIQTMFEENEIMKEQILSLKQDVEFLKTENQELKKNIAVLTIVLATGIIAAIILGIVL